MALTEETGQETSEFMRQLKAVAARLETRLELILSDGFSAKDARLGEAMRYAVLGGGKRIRPFLLIESASLFAPPTDVVYDVAAALECVHCYSLVHDDLPAMDDDMLRRGRPTVHVAFGEATAILAGDALLTLAFEILARPETHESAEVRAELIMGLARAAGWRGMVKGQALDLAAEGADPTGEEIDRIQALKTGQLIEFACDAGAILGRANGQQREALKTYAQALGRAFQLADDLLDADGDESTLGKAAQKDGAAGKATHVALLGVERAREQLGELEGQAIGALAPFGDDAVILAEAARFVSRRTH